MSKKVTPQPKTHKCPNDIIMIIDKIDYMHVEREFRLQKGGPIGMIWVDTDRYKVVAHIGKYAISLTNWMDNSSAERELIYYRKLFWGE